MRQSGGGLSQEFICATHVLGIHSIQMLLRPSQPVVAAVSGPIFFVVNVVVPKSDAFKAAMIGTTYSFTRSWFPWLGADFSG